MGINYLVVDQISAEYLERFVSARSKMGWKCQGGVKTYMYLRGNGESECRYIQAMTRNRKGANGYVGKNNND